MSELRMAAQQARAEREERALSTAQVEDLLRALSAALRSHRLYAGQGPALARFIEGLRARLQALWTEVPLLKLTVDEQSITWEGERVYPVGDSGTELAFLFFKDGIREITLLPGFEDEAERLFGVLGRAPQLREEEDDLITLLWQEQFASFHYQYVEPAMDGAEQGSPPAGNPTAVDPAAVRTAAAEPSAGLSPDDFQETLHFLDDAELQTLAAEVRREAERDLWADVIAALFDRLEDGDAERQMRIVRILGELLPSVLASAQFGRAAALLRETAEIASRPGVLSGPVLREVRQLFGQLARPEAVVQIVKVLEADTEALRDDGLERLLAFLPPEALAPLARAVATVTRPDVRRSLERVLERLAGDNRDEVVRLLGDADPAMVAVASRWAGQLGVGAAVGPLTQLLRNPEAPVRIAAVEALTQLRAAVSGAAIQALLDDPERDVRIAAARALAALEVAAARPALEAVLEGKRLRAADRSEKIAFYEAFGHLAGADGVRLLERTLSAKGWLGRGESPEIRACAALGLARVRHPAARAALTSAADDSDPVVRSAVMRALRDDPPR